MPSHSLVIVLMGLAVIATVAGIAVFSVGVFRLSKLITDGAPEKGRWNKPASRVLIALTRTITGNTFRSRRVIAALHWLVMVSFVLLFLTLVAAYGQISDPYYSLPVLGGWTVWHWMVELLAAASFVAIAALFEVRIRTNLKAKDEGAPRTSRFFGSTRWQAWFVEGVIALVGLSILVGDGLRFALETKMQMGPSAADFPLTTWWGGLLAGASATGLANAISVVATFKIVVSMTWMVVVGLNVGMGISWHRFLAPLNLATGRRVDGKVPLGALPLPLLDGVGTANLEERFEELEAEADEQVERELAEAKAAGKKLRRRDIEVPDLPPVGLGTTESLTWKDRLDVLSCTECGRCQDLCPAWNADKPLSPKLLTLALRDNAVAAAGATAPGQKQPESKDVLNALLQAGAIGPDGVAPGDTQLVPDVVDAGVLWDCTMCGACVDQCPVDISTVDRIANMRRYQILMESAFPRELAKPFRSMETKGNPYNQSPRRRMDWAKDLDFDIPVVFEDVDDASQFDYLFWVGCAGAYDDNAKRTTAAVAELLHVAGVSFGVLGSSEGCSGDPARRAGNEILFQMLAADTIETLNEAKPQRIVVTCAHCFNTILNEYPQFGASFDVIHHTELLNTLVKEGALTPVPHSSEGKDATEEKVTYQDPCFLGRYNQVYAPPRELLEHLNIELVEMAQNRADAMCCGAGGARAWMEETRGKRIASVRMEQAEQTQAQTVATACPFCSQMLLSAVSADTPSQVKDVAVLLLDGVRQGQEGNRPRQ